LGDVFLELLSVLLLDDLLSFWESVLFILDLDVLLDLLSLLDLALKVSELVVDVSSHTLGLLLEFQVLLLLLSIDFDVCSLLSILPSVLLDLTVG
jgi:hypothetical protein